MYRKLFTILLLLSVSVMLSAQVKASRSEKAKIPVSMEKVMDVDNSVTTDGVAKPMAVFPVKNNPTGDTIATTIYATFANSVIRHQVKYWNGVPNFCPMIEPNSKANRSVTYFRAENNNYVGTELTGPASTNRTGWGAMDIARTGSAIGTVGIVAHQPNTLNIWDPGSKSFVQNTFNPWLDPSIQILGDTIFMSESADRATAAGCALWKTYDYGVSFMLWDSLKNYSPKPIYFGAQGTGELAMFKSDNEKYAAYVGTNKGTISGAATSPHNWMGVNKDSCDNIWMINTSDKGLTWKGQTIGVAGVSGTLKGYPLPKAGCWFANFQQCQGAVGNDGVFHVVTNGYGLNDSNNVNITDDRWYTRIYPIVYWNSKLGTWKSISKIEIDTIADDRSTNGDPMTDWRQGNSMGQCWPAISTSPDGKVLFVVWTGPQFTGGLIDTTSIVVPTTQDAELIDMYTDIYYAYSLDGGDHFTYGGPLPGADKKKFAENFPTLDPILEKVTGGYQAHVMYLEQLPPFAQTSGTRPTDYLVYRKFKISTTAVENDVTPVSSFDLAQNYPNPFNPNTTIKYSIPSANKVTLKVYDVLGKEVASLVNDVKTAGTYEVNFDASKLASGMYIYSVTAGNYSASKKMMLLK